MGLDICRMKDKAPRVRGLFIFYNLSFNPGIMNGLNDFFVF